MDTRLAETKTDSDDQALAILNNQFVALADEARVIAFKASRARLAELRKPVVVIMKEHLAYFVSAVSKFESRTDGFLTTLAQCYLDKIDVEKLSDLKDSQWDDMIHFLRLERPEKERDRRGFRMYLLIRHYFDLYFKEDSILRDDLNKLVRDFKADDDYYLKVHQTMVKENYFDTSGTISVEQIKALEPVFKVLKERKLLSKINFIRLLLCPHPETTNKNRKDRSSTGYSLTYNMHFYQASPENAEILSKFILRMHNVDILTQKNLEVIFKVVELIAGFPQGRRLERMYQSFDFFCDSKTLEKNNDSFDTIMMELYHKDAKLDENVSALSSDVDIDPITSIMAGQLTSQLTEALLAQNQLRLTGNDTPSLPGAESTTALIAFAQNNQLSQTAANDITAYAPFIAYMTTLLYQDNIATPENLKALFYNAQHLETIIVSYRLLKDHKTFETPQEAFESLIQSAEYSKDILGMLSWMPLDQRTNEYYQEILDNGSYTKDMLAVCNFEISHFVRSEPVKDEDGIERLKSLRPQNSHFIFGNNIYNKKYYLKYFAVIYDFLERCKYPVVTQLMTLLNQHLQLVPFVAEDLKKQNTFADNAEGIKIFDKAYNDSMTRSAEENKKSLANLPANMQHFSPQLLSRERYTFSHDKVQLIQAFQVLEKAKLLSDQWTTLLNDFPEHSLKLAEAIVDLNACETSSLLEYKYVSLLKKKPEYADSIATVLLGYEANNSLDNATFQLLRKSLNSMPEFAKAFTPRVVRLRLMQEQLAIEAAKEQEVKEEDVRVNKLLLLQSGQSETPPPPPSSQPVVSLTPVPPTETKLEIKEEKTKPIKTYTETDFINELIGRCKVDFQRSGFFSRSVLQSTYKDVLPNKHQLMLHMKERPRSRTTKNYVHLMVEKMPEGDYKRFWNNYLKDYRFCWYQRSQLVDKFLNGEIKSINDVIRHAATNKNNRSNTILKM